MKRLFAHPLARDLRPGERIDVRALKWYSVINGLALAAVPFMALVLMTGTVDLWLRHRPIYSYELLALTLALLVWSCLSLRNRMTEVDVILRHGLQMTVETAPQAAQSPPEAPPAPMVDDEPEPAPLPPDSGQDTEEAPSVQDVPPQAPAPPPLRPRPSRTGKDYGDMFDEAVSS